MIATPTRRVVRRLRVTVLPQDVAHAANGVDQRGLSQRLELAAQPGDEHIDDITEALEIIVVDVIDDLGAAQHGLRPAKQQAEELELLRCQIEMVSALGRPSRDGTRIQWQRFGDIALGDWVPGDITGDGYPDLVLET